MIVAIVLSAFILCIIGYLFVGFYFGGKTKKLGDLLPIVSDRQAEVKNSKEFSASTVATSISLATVVLFFFEAAPGLGPWLLWCCVTTALGVYLVKVFSKPIWQKMSQYDHRPSLHEFLGVEFGSRKVALIGAVCTSLGYLGVFGLELYIGSVFLSGLLGGIPQWIIVVVVSLVGFTYTAIGGFRTVIVTDRIQMFTIWAFIAALFVFYFTYIPQNGGWAYNISKLPENVKSFTWDNNLVSFIIGIFIINICMFLVSMSIWQRIAATRESSTMTKGLWSSVLGTAFSWTLLVIAACLVYVAIVPNQNENPLTTLLNFVGHSSGLLPKIILFVSVIGLFGSQLSTASTQLIATAHTIYEDILSPYRKIALKDRIDLKRELTLSRVVLIIAAVLAITVVGVLSASGFSIVDLAFALYGSQLALFGPVIFALTKDRYKLKQVASYATIAVATGIILGWVAAAVGKIYKIQDLIFLSPVISLVSSSLILFMGFLVKKKLVEVKQKKQYLN